MCKKLQLFIKPSDIKSLFFNEMRFGRLRADNIVVQP